MDRNLYEWLCKFIKKFNRFSLNPVERDYLRDLQFVKELWAQYEPLSFLTKKILKDCSCLHCYLIPYRLEERLSKVEGRIVADIVLKPAHEYNKVFDKYTPNEVDYLLHDFINFVCEFKGHKIGVGDALIRRYIQDKSKKE